MRNVTENQRRYEEETHKRHAEIRAQARAGDGTIEAGEAELERIRAANYRREAARLRDALRDALEQKREVAR